MDNIIVVFGNRNHTMQFASYLKRMGVNCKTISTPRELSTSCGISVVFSAQYIKQARFLVDRLGFSTYAKFYLIRNNDIFKKYQPISNRLWLFIYLYDIINNMKNKDNLTTTILNYLRNIIDNPVSELQFNNEFELLIAVMLSAQCTDKRVNMVTSALFKTLKTPADFAKLSVEELEDKIKSINFFHNKAKHIIEASKTIVEKFDGQVPSNHDDLTSLSGVGNKTANVVEAVAFHKQALAVDTHILRVSNRLGLVATKNPTECEKKLKEIFCDADLTELHHLILLFGRYYCTARNPKCENCEFLHICNYKGGK